MSGNSCNRNHLNRFYLPDEPRPSEIAEQAQRRLSTGCCPDCGRPASVTEMDHDHAALRCGCGWAGTVQSGTRAYRAARVFVESRTGSQP